MFGPATELDPDRLEARTQAIGQELYRLATAHHAHLTSANRWARQVLTWCLGDPELKRRLLRFIDCLPSLRTPGAIARHLHEYLPTQDVRLPAALRLGVSLSRPGLWTAPAVAVTVHHLIERLAHQFIAGAHAEDAAALAQRFAAQGLLASFDSLGERVVSDEEADRYAQTYLALLEALGSVQASAAAAANDHPFVHVSVKPSGLSTHLDPLTASAGVPEALARLRPILRRVMDVKAGVTLDMEQFELRDVTLELTRQLLADPEFAGRLHLGVVIQAYLTDSDRVVGELIDWLSRRKLRLSVRLVKGAYWDSEMMTAAQCGWLAPVHRQKAASDETFEWLTCRLLMAHSLIRVEIASHNLRSIAHAMAAAEALGLPKEALEIQVLYGMGEVIQEAVRRLGYPVRVYTPVGALVPGMAYLVRRILENTANESFLRQEAFEHVAAQTLLQAPSPSPETASPASIRKEVITHPMTNFADPARREAVAQAIEEVRRGLGRDYSLLIGPHERTTGRWIESVNPAHPRERVGRVAQAGAAELEEAVRVGAAAQEEWGRRSIAERARLLRKAAELLSVRHDWWTALEVLEVGKPWREADVDVVETIQYLEYYSHAIEELAQGRALIQKPGEANRYVYVPRGVCAVIAPWNFPLAILCGMSSAALAAGNAVILKPSEQSPVIAAQFVRLLREAGFPPEVVQYLPGAGEEVGRGLVEHPQVRLVMFTGSKSVGLSILEACGRVRPGQRFVKQVVVEMGGKNALIIDDDADLDAAIDGILRSAFSYAGQKCSALSRLIVHVAVYDELLSRLGGAVEGLRIGDPADPSMEMGPLIEPSAVARIRAAVEHARRDARLVYEYPASRLPQEGYFAAPALVADVSPAHPLAQEELFGPVLCVFRAKTFEEALALANDSQYGLTGGVYSRSPSNIQQAIDTLEVGNLYINRAITGAMVGRQPFGGMKLSGLGTKAGGPDYLLSLLLPKTICENTARHGMPLE